MKPKILMRRVTFYVLGAILVIAVGLLLWQAGLRQADFVSDSVGRFFARPFFSVGSIAVTPAFLIKTALYFVVLGMVTGFTRRAIQNRILSRTMLDPGRQYALGRITSYLVFVVGLVVGLESAGLKLDSLLLFGGTVGIGVGLGLQNLANNFVSGLVLLFEQPVKLGDRIDVGGVVGDVVKIAGRSTWIRTNENVVIIVPNSEFVSNRVINWTANDRRVRFSLPLGVSYKAEPERVREILSSVARNNKDVLEEPTPDVLFLGFGDSALDFELRVWTTRVETPQVLKSDLYFEIFRALQENGIEIPFPQRDLHLKSVAVRFPVSLSQS